jgi:hypothetical protein
MYELWLFGDVSSISRIFLMYSRVLPLNRNRVLHAVKELLMVALLRVPSITSDNGAVIVNRCSGGTCN